MRTIKDYLLIGLKGIGMGAADVVPGVSGGTIAFITGIYEELIDTINKVNLKALQVLFKEGIPAFWKHINGWFLLSLLSGIGISILSLAKLITYLLDNEPVAIWSFFFGLVLASIPFVGQKVKHWTPGPIIGFFAGAIIAYWITILPMSSGEHGLLFIFLSGLIAICAMILPGISGSFILLLLGAYTTVLTAIKDLDIVIIAVFAAGAVIGLLSFARVLKWMFGHYHDITIALLSGFLLGSLNKIWPWKITVEDVQKPNGEVVPVLQDSVLPSTYENGGFEAHFWLAIGLFFVGILTIVVLEKVGQKNQA